MTASSFPAGVSVLIQEAVPGSPTIGSAVAGPGQATVSWSAPASSGSAPITGYRVTPYIGFSPMPSTTFASTATTQTVTGLIGGLPYRFRVQAISSVGTGGFSTVTNQVTPTVLTVPGSPTIGTATGGDGQASVSWTAPTSDGGSPILGYVVTPYIGFFPLDPQVFFSSDTTQSVTGLPNGTSFRFPVQALNAIGVGGFSKVTNQVTLAP